MSQHYAIYPSLISSDILHLAQVIQDLDPYAAGYHLDVMDNHFVPNLTMGHMFINKIALLTHRQLWIHLMITDPLSFLDRLEIPEQSIVGFHIETNKHIDHVVNKITENNWLPCVAISPKTNLEKIFPFTSRIYQANIMSVEPGFSGQRFIPEALDRISELVAYRAQHNLNFVIGVDGGINEKNIFNICMAGGQNLAIASALFAHPNPRERLLFLQNLIHQ